MIGPLETRVHLDIVDQYRGAVCQCTTGNATAVTNTATPSVGLETECCIDSEVTLLRVYSHDRDNSRLHHLCDDLRRLVQELLRGGVLP